MFKFINRIQNSGEETRKVWMFVSSAITMAVVVALWLIYLNFTIAGAEPLPSGFAGTDSARDSRPMTQDSLKNDPGVFAIFSAGVKTIYDQVRTKVFEATNNIAIENIDRNFQVDDLEPIPATKLP